jgi:hypothetical protein
MRKLCDWFSVSTEIRARVEEDRKQGLIVYTNMVEPL